MPADRGPATRRARGGSYLGMGNFSGVAPPGL